MAVMLVLGLIYYYLNNFLMVFMKFQEVQQFSQKFDTIYTNFGIEVNRDKK